MTLTVTATSAVNVTLVVIVCAVVAIIAMSCHVAMVVEVEVKVVDVSWHRPSVVFFLPPIFPLVCFVPYPYVAIPPAYVEFVVKFWIP